MKINFLCLLLLILLGCKKNSETLNQTLSHEDNLTDAQLQLIESESTDTIFKLNDALFPDGDKIINWAIRYDNGYDFKFNTNKSSTTVFDKKRLFIERMTEAGGILVNDKLYTFPSQFYGLAYVFGSKKFDIPAKYLGANCSDLLYGLDCSGMIKQMGLASGFDLVSDGTVNYVKISTWNNAFMKSIDFVGLEMSDLQNLPAYKLQAGDIIVAPEAHIGIVFTYGGGDLKIFNSLGSKSYSCAKNSDAKHGPVITNSVENWLEQVFNNNYHVLRPIYSGPDINNSTWDVTITLNGYVWHADVKFYQNGRTLYDEPSSPGLYLLYGTWSQNGNQIHWEKPYIFDGVISGSTMIGTYIYGNKTYNWTAAKRY